MGLDDPARCRRLAITRVRHTSGLDQEQVNFLLGHWAVLGSLGDNEQLSGSQSDVPIAQLNGQLPLQHQKEIIALVVLVPGEFPFHLHHHQVVPVEGSHRSWLPVFVERGQFLGKVHSCHGSLASAPKHRFFKDSLPNPPNMDKSLLGPKKSAMNAPLWMTSWSRN